MEEKIQKINEFDYSNASGYGNGSDLSIYYNLFI